MPKRNTRLDFEVLSRFKTGTWAVQPGTGEIYTPGERRMLKTRENNRGYLTISVPPLSSCYPLSRAVWIGATLTIPVFDDLEVDHINGNKKDNRFKNLRLLTPAGNRQTSDGSGRRPLTYADAEALRREYENGGVTLKELAQRCGRSMSAVGSIIRGESFTKPAVPENRNGRIRRPLDDKLRYGVFKDLCLEGRQASSVMQKYRITQETLRSIIEEQSLRAERIPDAAEQQEAAV